MFAFLARHRYWTLGAVVALMAAGLVFAFSTDGLKSNVHANTVSHSAKAHNGMPSDYETIQDQLRQQGYHLAGTDGYNSSDAHRTISYQTWQADGRPTVYVTDAYPGTPGSYVIDTVSYNQTVSYGQFWCVPPSPTNATNLVVTLDAAASERTSIETGAHKPVASGVPGTDKVVGSTVCYMK